MNYKPDEATLISYLYGELEGDEHRNVEEYLTQHPEERKKVEEWAFAREAMSRLQDKEVIAPPIILEGTPARSIWKEPYVRIPLGIAASFLIVMIAARLLGLSATYSQDQLTISFGSREKRTPAITEQQVGQMIEATVKENNQALQASWQADRQALEESIRKNLGSNSSKIDKMMVTASAANQEQVRSFVSQMQTENLKLMRDYMQLSATGQKEYIEKLLVDFSGYLQEQRKQDIQLFQTRMNNIEENNDQFKQETEQILTSLISTSGASNQRKY